MICSAFKSPSQAIKLCCLPAALVVCALWAVNAENAERVQANLRIEQVRQAQPMESKARFHTFMKLGCAQLNSCSYDLAEECFAAALKETSNFKVDDSTLVDANFGLATAYLFQQRYKDAVPLLELNEKLSSKLYGATDPSLTLSLLDLAVAYDRTGKVEKAEPLFKRMLAIWEAAPAEQNYGVVNSLNNLATFYIERNRLAEAQPYLIRAVALMEKQKEPDVEFLLNRMDKLAESYFPKQFEKTESILLRRFTYVSNDDASQYDAANQLAQLYIDRKMFNKAMPYLKVMEIRTDELVKRGFIREENSQYYDHMGLMYSRAGKERSANKYFRLAELELTKPQEPYLTGATDMPPEALAPYRAYSF